MNIDEKVIPIDVDLVRFDNPEMVANKPAQTTTKVPKNVHSLRIFREIFN